MNKQLFLLSFVVAAIATLAVGCQKETDTVTLGAEIQKTNNGNSKVYIDDHTPCWHNGDEVYINNAAYPIIAASGASARIENVVTNSTYRAIFPASIRRDNMNITNRSNVNVILPAEQHYERVGNHQRVDVPMGAYITSGSTLQFYNLCSVVRVIVSNSTNQEIPLRRIMLQAENAMLSGAGTVTISGEPSNSITMSNYSTRHDVSLSFTSDCPATVEARGTSTFDIVVPAFATDDVTLTLYTTDGYYCEVTKEDVALVRNTITTVTLNVTELTEMPHAELINGSSFMNIIRNIGIENVYDPYSTLEEEVRMYYVTAVVFEYNSVVNSGIRLSTYDSPVPIYGNMEGTVLKVSTIANIINANPDCRYMFFEDEYFGTIESEGGHIETIDFGNGFNTSNVMDMSEMFMSCSRLTNLDVSNFNTSNVTSMGGMFFGCSGLASLDVSNFNTSRVTNMNSMFSYCELTSIDVSSFNTSNVEYMISMFDGCSGLTNLDLSNFNTSNVENMNSMFRGCSGLTTLDLSNFNTSNVIDMSGMFHRCSALTSLNLSNFDMSNVTSKSRMCFSLSTTSGYCTITCPLAVEDAIKELNPNYDPTRPYSLIDPFSYYYISGLPTSGVAFTWVRP